MAWFGHIDDSQRPNKVTTFRRLLPQFLESMAKNLIVVNKALFDGFPSIVIAALGGHSPELNPNETVKLDPGQISWLSTFAFIMHPIGGVVGGKLCDKHGRTKVMMVITVPILIAFVALGFSTSYEVICIGFATLGFVFGMKEAPTITYVSEISEPSIRGTIMAIGPLASSIGLFILYLLGSLMSWRQVSIVCAFFPVAIFIAVFLIPESPIWLLSVQRSSQALCSLQWLRGWVSSQAVQNEYIELQNYAELSNACSVCEKQSIRCNHPRPTFRDKIKEFKRKRSMKPFILIVALQFFVEFSGISVWTPYIIQVLKAQGIPMKANWTTVIMSAIGFFAHICLLLTVRMIGKRKICLYSTFMVALCCFGLGFYGYAFFPPGWSSFSTTGDDEFIRNIVGDYGYVAMILVFIMQFCTKMGIAGATLLLIGEVFPFKARSFLSGVAVGCRYIFASIATKTYYGVEEFLSLPGAISFYGTISLIGWILMYYILPETEHRSLRDIELHYSDNTKRITDIHIRINRNESE